MAVDEVVPALLLEDVREEGLRLGRSLSVVELEQPVARLEQDLVDTLALGQAQGAPVAEEEVRPIGISLVPQLQCGGVEPIRGLERPQRGRPVARGRQRDSCAIPEQSVLAARCAREIERREVVVREQLGVVRGTAERLDPLGCAPVLLHPCSPQDLPVGDIADELVPERELGLAGDGRPALPPDELLALE